jgi:hypothetical protein
VKDLRQHAWKYFIWLLVRKLMLAAIMGLTIGAVNAGAAVMLQVADLSVIVLMKYAFLWDAHSLSFTSSMCKRSAILNSA